MSERANEEWPQLGERRGERRDIEGRAERSRFVFFREARVTCKQWVLAVAGFELPKVAPLRKRAEASKAERTRKEEERCES